MSLVAQDPNIRKWQDDRREAMARYDAQWTPGEPVTCTVTYSCPPCEVGGSALEGQLLVCWACGDHESLRRA